MRFGRRLLAELITSSPTASVGNRSADDAGRAGCPGGAPAATEGEAGWSAGAGDAGRAAGVVFPTSAETAFWVGAVATDALLLTSEGPEFVREPPELRTTPERGPAVPGLRREELESARESADFCALPDRVDPGDESDRSPRRFDEPDWRESLDDFPDSDEFLELEADDEPDEPLSPGSANATPGVVDSDAPTLSANARTPRRTFVFLRADPVDLRRLLLMARCRPFCASVHAGQVRELRDPIAM